MSTVADAFSYAAMATALSFAVARLPVFTWPRAPRHAARTSSSSSKPVRPLVKEHGCLGSRPNMWLRAAAVKRQWANGRTDQPVFCEAVSSVSLRQARLWPSKASRNLLVAALFFTTNFCEVGVEGAANHSARLLGCEWLERGLLGRAGALHRSGNLARQARSCVANAPVCAVAGRRRRFLSICGHMVGLRALQSGVWVGRLVPTSLR